MHFRALAEVRSFQLVAIVAACRQWLAGYCSIILQAARSAVQIPCVPLVAPPNCFLRFFAIATIIAAPFGWQAKGGEPKVLRTIEITRLSAGEFIRPTHPMLAVRRFFASALSVDGELTLVAVGNDQFMLVDLDGGKRSSLIRPFPGLEIRDAAIAADGKTLAALSGSQQLKVFKISGEGERYELSEVYPLGMAGGNVWRAIVFAQNSNFLYVTHHRNNAVVVDVFDLDRMTKTDAVKHQHSGRRHLESLFATTQGRVVGAFSSLAGRGPQIEWRLEVLFGAPAPVYKSVGHRLAVVDSAESTSSFAEQLLNGKIRVARLGAEYEGWDASYTVTPERRTWLAHTLGVSSRDGDLYAIGSERIVGAGRQPVLLNVFKSGTGPSVEGTAYELPTDVFSVAPIGFIDSRDELLVELLREDPVRNTVVLQLQLLAI